MNFATWTRKAAAVLFAASLAVSATHLHAQRYDDHHDDHHGPQNNNRNDHGPNDNRRDGGRNNRADYHFRGDNDRSQFGRYYRNDAQRWRNNRNRPSFQVGGVIPRNYAIRPVPQSYYRGVPPPPPGYNFGYYDGYVVAYDPTTRIVADILDLATGNY